jgi:hypothetical protein
MRRMGYRKRKFGDNPLYRILSDHWQNFLDAYEHRFQRVCGALRSVACDVVKRFLDCGNPMNGFARIKCESCGAEKLLYFSCKTRGFCPSCQARRAEEWAMWFADNLSEPANHHQIVFTIPKMLRSYFRFNRKLMTDLSRAANRAVVRFIQQTAGKEITPAMVVVKHTHGEGVRFHPHLHTLPAAGGWDKERVWHTLPAWNQSALRELFQIEVFRFLREKELLPKKRMEMILSWRHSGFNVHISEPIQAGDKAALTRVARYMLRSPVVISRLSYDREGQKVKINKRNTTSGDEIVLDVLDFIARLSAQIPDPHERIVLYYGLYSNASGTRRTTQDEKELTPPATGFSRSGESEYSKSRRIRWAKLIAKVWKEDPLLCAKCGGKMRIISFITDPVVIDKILRHIDWNYRDPPPPRYHPPPQLCSSPLC